MNSHIDCGCRFTSARRLAFYLSFGSALFSFSAAAEEIAALDIKHLTLEQLADIQVYSASRHYEPTQGVPAAIFVLTNEDIRRSRVTNIPDALRLVPGVQVARIDGNKWGVTIRGFLGGIGGASTARTANKLLVLVDGRSIYDPFFSGVFWETWDLMLTDIDRIEVIRGPGGSIWGANAVNGVINIITRNARDSQGGVVNVGGGTEERAFASTRYGWQIGDKQFARVYAKVLERDTGYSPSHNAYDAMQGFHTGFRWDMDATTQDSFRISGDFGGTEAGQRDPVTPSLPITRTQDVDHRIANLTTAWERRISSNESMRAQLYYDYLSYDAITVGEQRHTIDFEFVRNLAVGRNQFTWGLGYRNTHDDIYTQAITFKVSPPQRTDQTFSTFVQDTISLVPQRLALTLGTKFEHNDYTNFEAQPNVRLAWTPTQTQTWWASASHAVRVPSRLEADVTTPTGDRYGDSITSEKVNAFEIGYRQLLTKDLWLDATSFYNRYHDLVTNEGTALLNHMQGDTSGVELATRWQVTPAWRLDATYTYLWMDLTLDAGSTATTTPQTAEDSNPRYRYTLRSALDISKKFEFDTILRHVEELPAMALPAYTAVDLGLGWHIRHDLDLSLVARDLFNKYHAEQLVVPDGAGTEVQQGYFAKLTWRF